MEEAIAQNSQLRQQLQEVQQQRDDAISHLSQVENAQPSQQLEALSVLRDRILASLKLGKQAPGYKVARKVLDQFIREVL